MDKQLFREELVKLLYTSTLNPDINLTDYTEEIKEIYIDVKSHLSEIDEFIEANLENWSLNRLNYVDLAIIRYAVYELMYLNHPKEIVMNEAVELTKKYSNLDDDKARKFNNRLLQNIVDALGEKDA
ncbi:MAG: transcription antitermination protein NusB [Candidatus Izimaplasma sp.]|nr:transcription antitermination protein NusB [Candidatus Izimaplasma bacterium]